jgi:hypothetical protein
LSFSSDSQRGNPSSSRMQAAAKDERVGENSQVYAY